MDISKCNNRDRKLDKKKNGMRISGRSLFVLEEVKKKRAEKIKHEREEKERLLKERIQEDESV